MSRVCAIVGAGPGLGASAARRFAREGYTVALLARTSAKLDNIHSLIQKDGGKSLSIACDASDAASVSAAFAQIRSAAGDPEVLIYNAGAFKMGKVAEVSPQEFLDCWKANCFGGFLAAHEALPAMLKQGKGTILFTGATAALRGAANFSCLAVGKFGLRALSQSLAKEVGPQGIHVAHVIIDGQILIPGRKDPNREENTYLQPESIAEQFWSLHQQPPTTWTQEMDLRPFCEKF